MTEKPVEKTANDYTDLAADAVEQVALAYDDLSKCIADNASAQDQLLTMRHLIESKKNKMISAGEIVGKNAEERAANAWIAIPEYDDLVILESNANTARANYDIVKAKLSAWKARLSFYTQMIDTLADSHLWSLDGELDYYEEDCIS